MSIFCLSTRMREAKERGGPNPGPSKVTPNPEGGNIFTPFMASNRKKMAESGGGWGFNTPHIKVDGAQFGNDFIPLFGPFMRKIMKHKECDSSSMTPAVTAGGQKRQRESKLKFVISNFRESAAPSGEGIPNKFRVVLIEEGMGNSSDAYYYTREALESAIEVFNGLKIMADHPTDEEEQIRPERSTRDTLGHYENLGVEQLSEGQSVLCADLDIVPSQDTEWARARMVRAIENAPKFPGKDFVGLSINASGPSAETPIEDVISMAPEGAKQKLIDAQNEGIETVKVVSKINRARSCDLVTEAGAGGKFLNIIGGDTDGQKTA